MSCSRHAPALTRRPRNKAAQARSGVTADCWIQAAREDQRARVHLADRPVPQDPPLRAAQLGLPVQARPVGRGTRLVQAPPQALSAPARLASPEVLRGPALPLGQGARLVQAPPSDPEGLPDRPDQRARLFPAPLDLPYHPSAPQHRQVPQLPPHLRARARRGYLADLDLPSDLQDLRAHNRERPHRGSHLLP